MQNGAHVLVFQGLRGIHHEQVIGTKKKSNFISLSPAPGCYFSHVEIEN